MSELGFEIDFNGFVYADDEVAQAFADITYLNAVRS
jgi:hypothetical protein